MQGLFLGKSLAWVEGERPACGWPLLFFFLAARAMLLFQ